MAITSDLSKGLMFKDDCESWPLVGNWGGDYTKMYAAVTGGTQDPTGQTEVWQSNMNVVDTYARKGTKSYRQYVVFDPNFPGQKEGGTLKYIRSEVMWQHGGVQGSKEHEWGFGAISFLIDPSWKFEHRPVLIAFDTKTSPDNYTTPFGIEIRGDKFRIGFYTGNGGKGEYYLPEPVKLGVWYDVVQHRNWEDNANGFNRVYMNGKLIWEHKGPNIRKQPGDSNHARIQHGPYKWVWSTSDGAGWGNGIPAENQHAPVIVYYDQISFWTPNANPQEVLASFGDNPLPPPPPPPVELYDNIEINCGAADDKLFSGGHTYKVNDPIENTTNDLIYQDERFGNFSYTIPMKNGKYMLNLHFAEIYWKEAGVRVFNVKVNGNDFLTNYDIFAKAGALTAVVESLVVDITDEKLVIEFSTVKDNASVTAISVATYMPPPPAEKIKLIGVSVDSTESGIATTLKWSDGSEDKISEK